MESTLIKEDEVFKWLSIWIAFMYIYVHLYHCFNAVIKIVQNSASNVSFKRTFSYFILYLFW